MSDVSRTVLSAAMADLGAIRDTLSYVHSVTASQGAQGEYVPLSERTSGELLAKAEEMRRMAQTARTADVAKALVTLADRYSALAARRRAEAHR